MQNDDESLGNSSNVKSKDSSSDLPNSYFDLDFIN